jgi:AcrR family transcriptional regulator
MEAPDLSGRRAELVAAAFQRIAADGFEGLRTRDVAADVGVNIATLHYYFPTKEALIRGVIGYAMHRFRETLPRDGACIEQLRAHLRGLARLMREDRALWAVMGELVLRAPRDSDLEHIFRQADTTWQRQLAELLGRCVEEGSLPATLDPDGVAALMVAALRGVSLPTAAVFRPESTDQVFRQLERMLGLDLPARKDT